MIQPEASTITENLRILVDSVMQSMTRGNLAHRNWAIDSLEAYFAEVDTLCYHLKFRMENLPPWIDALEAWMWTGRRALLVLRALERGQDYTAAYSAMLDSLEMAQHKPGGETLLPLIEYVCGLVTASIA